MSSLVGNFKQELDLKLYKLIQNTIVDRLDTTNKCEEINLKT